MSELRKDNFAKMVDDDIAICEKGQVNNEQFTVLYSKYDNYIAGIAKGMNGYVPSTGFLHPSYLQKMDSEPLKHNVNVLKGKLIAFRANGYQDNAINSNGNNININNELTASQTQIMNITYSEAKSRIENMPGLSESDTKDALEKLGHIEKILSDKEASKKSKWGKLSPILKWLADKSIDVGITFLPLMLQHL